MALSAADALVDPVTRIDGFRIACLLDASTGMALLMSFLRAVSHERGNSAVPHDIGARTRRSGG